MVRGSELAIDLDRRGDMYDTWDMGGDANGNEDSEMSLWTEVSSNDINPEP